MLDGMCPHIINYVHCSPNDVEELTHLNGLTEADQQSLNDVIAGAYVDGSRQISYIAMEFMDGYEVANSAFLENPNGQKYAATPNDQFLLNQIQYEFQRLNNYGYKHGDAHLGNVMS